MSDSLTVHVNRTGLHSLEVPERFAATDSFDVVVVNHGGASHVHVRVDDALSEQVTVEAPNHHVAGGDERRIRVTRTGEEPARGELKVVTAHGSQDRTVDVRLGADDAPVVDVEPAEESEQLGSDERRALAVGGAAVLALGLTAGAVAGSIGAAAVVGVLGACGVLAAVWVNRAT